jgi:hypothetical protein
VWAPFLHLSAWLASRQCLNGNKAFAVAVDGDRLPFISAARFGNDRVISFGHSEAMLGVASTTELFKLVRSSAVWASGKTYGIRIAGLDSWGSNIAASIAKVGSFTCVLLQLAPVPRSLHVRHQPLLRSTGPPALLCCCLARGMPPRRHLLNHGVALLTHCRRYCRPPLAS